MGNTSTDTTNGLLCCPGYIFRALPGCQIQRKVFPNKPLTRIWNPRRSTRAVGAHANLPSPISFLDSENVNSISVRFASVLFCSRRRAASAKRRTAPAKKFPAASNYKSLAQSGVSSREAKTRAFFPLLVQSIETISAVACTCSDCTFVQSKAL